MPLTDEEIRRGLVEALYLGARERPERSSLSRAELLDVLKVADNVLDACLSKLIDRGLISVEREPGESFSLTEEGLRALKARELSYCPHL